MSTRWFFSCAQVGAAAAASGQALQTSVLFAREIGGEDKRETAAGPTLSLVGPGDVLGFDRAVVLREEPRPGSAPAAENVLAGVELAHADLPWLLSPGQATTPSGPTPLPWISLIVLAEDEAAPPRAAGPLPVLTAPVAALPPPAERWAWAHVEARLPDSVTDLAAAQQLAMQGVRNHSADVVARLLCPRKLEPDRGWIAAVVPATAAGRAAGLNTPLVGPGTADAWPAGDGATVDLPVYHWWTFRTAAAGTFEELARRLRFRPAAEAGLGTRTIDVGRPWPAEQETGPASVALDGALRVPGTAAPEVWSDTAAQDRFRALARMRLDAPALRRTETGSPVEDRDTAAVAPPLYGSHHTGQQTVPDDPNSWMSTLNLEVRRRVAAALGARYVQLEQEFLMARAWEQVGEIRQANRLLAVGELAAAAAEQAQSKHLAPLDVADLVTVMAPVSNRMPLSDAVAGPVGAPTTLATMLAASPVPTGAADTSFVRLTRRSGALARRAGRVATGGATVAGGPRPVIEERLSEMGLVGAEAPEAGLPGELRAGVGPQRLQLLRMTDRIPAGFWARRSESEARPLRPIMAHPKFTVPIAEELLARWPEWAVPGIGALPPDSVTLLETNPEFAAALLVGLNHEFNRELLWREFPTDQRGTPFARFWPGDEADVDEIARWPLDAPLGSGLRTGGEGHLVLLVRGELLRRFPGTALLAVRGEEGRLPAAFGGLPGTPLALDESTVLYLFAGIDEQRARAEDWFFVFREPMRGTQFGFDSGPPVPLKTWADLTWSGVTLDAARCVRLAPAPAVPGELPPADPPVWGRDAADMARITFQQPFQLAFRATTLLGG
ncbi:hypothetical protein ACH46N_01710 [Streptomyces pristinaespiralis]|uniref:Putative helicase n=2 Tax=Streptomyces pristinaespiralis TaxID=38300 RepID=A0A0M4D279_STRPR|nr:hypothetical protein [Streptomyces pristinaespiralis]ALC19716.1 putative helicase [Streptomyces pristinaespiralis]QMU17299.1 hypothetical protein H3L99_29905 [Streptomyces pristinaespiralis]